VSEPDDFSFNCSECGELDCDIDHDDECQDDDSWMFDCSGMVGDD